MNRKIDDLDRLVAEIQAEVDKQDKEDFSEYALELMKNPYNYGNFGPDSSIVTEGWRGPCGDKIIFHLDIENDVIVNAKFEVDGCSVSTLVGSQTIKMIENKSIEEVRKITEKDLIKALIKFPEDSYHCATLSITTLNMTLDKYENKKKGQ